MGRLCIFAAAVLWSTSGVFAKSPVFDVWPPEVRGPVLAFWRAVFAGLLILPMVRGVRFRPALVPMTLCFVVMNVTFLTAMTMTTAGNVIWLQHTAPAWVFLFGVLLLGEPLVRRNQATPGRRFRTPAGPACCWPWAPGCRMPELC